jgi:shikimate kinase
MTTPHWVLVGAMGSGKSTIGERVAKRTGRAFIDNDRTLRETTGMQASDLEASRGVDALHRAEVEALHHMLDRGDPSVVAAAAAVVDDPEGQALLRNADQVIWLDVPIDVLKERIAEQDAAHRPPAAIDAIVARTEARADRYRDAASMVVDANRPPDEVADEIVTRLRAADG